jgi:hypothetical protein
MKLAALIWIKKGQNLDGDPVQVNHSQQTFRVPVGPQGLQHVQLNATAMSAASRMKRS